MSNSSSSPDINGYIPHFGSKGLLKIKVDDCSRSEKMDIVLKHTLSIFIELCLAHNVDLYIFISPSLLQSKCKGTSYAHLKESFPDNEIISYYDSLQDYKYYFDTDHLNNNGATAYTSRIASLIKERISGN